MPGQTSWEPAELLLSDHKSLGEAWGGRGGSAGNRRAAGGFYARLPAHKLPFSPVLEVAPGHSGLPERCCLKPAPNSSRVVFMVRINPVVGDPLPASCGLSFPSWKSGIQGQQLGQRRR